MPAQAKPCGTMLYFNECGSPLYANLYYHPRVAGVNQRACELLRAVFEAYLEKPSLLGRTSARRIKSHGLHRTVCDFVAGMTDRYLISEHARLFGSGS